MIKERPDHHDAELVLRLYDLRRESVMRQSRDAMLKFLPRTWDDFNAVLQFGHPHNAAWRQTSSYWEMAYGFAKHGVVNPDFLIESSAEGLFLYAKVLPHLERMRKEVSPTAFQNAEWIVQNSPLARQRLELIQGRIKKMMEAS